MAVAGFTNLNGGEANKAYYEAEIAEAAQDAARAKLSAYYATPMAARWVSLSSTLAPDGAEIAPGEISRAFDGLAPLAFTARDRKGQAVTNGEIADRLDAPNRRAGTDMTISQPKSYSALVQMAELAGEAVLARDLREARHQVVREVVKHALDIGLVQTRRGHGGADVETPADVMVAVVPHSKSRAGDPQEHDHVLWFNGSLRGDGTTGTLDLSRLVSHKFYLQAMVGAGMAERMQRLGFAVQESGRGQWELAGAPEGLLKAWSTRRAEVVAGLRGTAAEIAKATAKAEAEGQGEQPGQAQGQARPARSTAQAKREAMQASALKSRRAKDEMPDAAALAARYREDLGKLGLAPDGVIDHMRAVAPHTPLPDGEPAEAGLDALFTRTSVATMRQVRTAIAEAAAVRGRTVEGVEQEIGRALTSGAVKAIGVASSGEAVFSTAQAMETERAMLLAAREGQGQGVLKTATAERAMQEIEARERAAGRQDFAFADEQRAAVLHAARGDRVAVLEGVAGAGKTTSMEAVVRAAHAQGLHTIGVAPTNAAAETLRAETGAGEHLSLQKLAADIAQGRRTLTSRDYVLVDEAGMAESGDVATVVRAASSAGAQVLLVGDERQFSPIGAGAPFAALAGVLGSSRMAEVRRQRVAWQNDAARRMAAGDSEAGTLAYAAEGRWTFGRDRADAFARLREDWTADLGRAPGQGKDRASRLVIAQRNEDVHALNSELRDVLVKRGALGAEEIAAPTLHRNGGAGEIRDLAMRAGDELVVWRRVPAHNLNNGDRLTVLGFQPMPDSKVGDVLLTWRVEKSGAVVTSPLSSLTPPPAPDDPAGKPALPHLQHAYAVTMHAAQGKTVDQGFVYGGTGLDARGTYVALTRQRDDARVYWDRGGIAQELAERGERPTHAAVVGHIRQEARRVSEARSVLDFVPDADAWLATGNPEAARERPSAVAAQAEAGRRTAEATVRAAAERRLERVAELAHTAAAEMPREGATTPRMAAEERAANAYTRHLARLRQEATARAASARRRVEEVARALRRPGAAARVASKLREVPRRARDLAGRAFGQGGPAAAPPTRAFGHVAKPEGPRATHAAPAPRQGPAATERDPMRQQPPPRENRPERQAQAEHSPHRDQHQVVHQRHAAERGPGGHAPHAGLSAEARAALARPGLGETPGQARTVAAGFYAETLERERAGLERRLVASVSSMTGKGEDQVRAELAEAVARPEAVRNAGLRAGVERLHALTAAREEVAGAIAEGRVRAAAPVKSLDPHASPVSWRVEVRKAGQATGDFAPMPDPAADRAVFDGRSVTVADALALLRARREALGVPSGIPAKAGTAAAVLDLAAGTLREAVIEERLSARARIAAAPPSDRKEWRAAFRDAVAEHAKGGGAGRGKARAQGREAAERSYQRERQASLEAQSLGARDAHAPAAERAVEAMRQAEMARRAAERQQAQRAQQEQRETPRYRGPSMGM